MSARITSECRKTKLEKKMIFDRHTNIESYAGLVRLQVKPASQSVSQQVKHLDDQ